LDISFSPGARHHWRDYRELTVWKLMEIFPRLASLDVSSTIIGDRLYRNAPAKRM